MACGTSYHVWQWPSSSTGDLHGIPQHLRCQCGQLTGRDISTIEGLQVQLAAADAEKRRLVGENEALRRALEMHRDLRRAIMTGERSLPIENMTIGAIWEATDEALAQAEQRPIAMGAGEAT